jgi:hypothetical protein
MVSRADGIFIFDTSSKERATVEQTNGSPHSREGFSMQDKPLGYLLCFID